MKLLSLIARLRLRASRPHRIASIHMTVREWADLPVHHPLRPDR
jgi:hypothetical protein